MSKTLPPNQPNQPGQSSSDLQIGDLVTINSKTCLFLKKQNKDGSTRYIALSSSSPYLIVDFCNVWLPKQPDFAMFKIYISEFEDCFLVEGHNLQKVCNAIGSESADD
jgi:hypothetical protein